MTYGQIIASATNITEFLDLIKQHYPRDIALNYDKLNAFAEYQYKTPAPTYVSPFTVEDFPEVPIEMSDWARNNLAQPQPDPQVFIN